MGSKSKRRHAQKQYNRAQNKPAVSADADAAVVENNDAVANENKTETATVIMTPKELRKAEKERAKQEKLLRKQQAQNAKEKNKNKDKKDNKEKKPFFLVRFFRWIGRGIASIFSELKKVHWPTAKQVFKSTGIVLGIVVLFGIILLVVWILFGLLHYLLVNGSLSGWTVF